MLAILTGCDAVARKAWLVLGLLSLLIHFTQAYGQATKLIVAYASLAATFYPGWIAKREGLFIKQYDAIGGAPFPWQAGIESMITGFHERFNPQGIKTAMANRSLIPPLCNGRSSA